MTFKKLTCAGLLALALGLLVGIFLSIPTFAFVKHRPVSFRMSQCRSFDRREFLFDTAPATRRAI